MATNRKGFSGQTNKRNDEILIARIVALLNSDDYIFDHMTERIEEYVARYRRIHSLTDKSRFHIKCHLELHKRELE